MRKPYQLFLIAVTVGLIFCVALSPQTAIACGPPHLTPEQNVASADAVFYGKVREVQALNALWMFGHMFDTRLAVDVTRSWKGVNSTAIHVYGSPYYESLHKWVEVGDEYLFLLNQEDGGAWILANQPCGTGMIQESGVYKYLPQLEERFAELPLQQNPIPYIWPMQPNSLIFGLIILSAVFLLVAFVINQIFRFVVGIIKNIVQSERSGSES